MTGNITYTNPSYNGPIITIKNTSAHNISNGDTKWSPAFSCELPGVSSNIFARFQVEDVYNDKTYAYFSVQNYNNAFATFRLAHDGNAYAGAWVGSSDPRIKKDFVKLTGALDKIKSLIGYESFSKLINQNDSNQYGVFCGVRADHVAAVLPAAVSSFGSGVDIDGNRIDNISAVDPLGLSALWVEGIKELCLIVDALTARIEALESAQGSSASADSGS